MELLVYCGMRLLYRARLPWRMRFFESQQSGIVAQIFLWSGNLRTNFLSRTRFRTRKRAPVKCQRCNCNRHSATLHALAENEVVMFRIRMGNTMARVDFVNSTPTAV